MIRSTSQNRLSIMFAVVASGVVASSGVSLAAPDAAWDQKRVTAISQQLVTAVDKLYHAEYKAPGESYLPALGADDSHHEFMDTLRRLQDETRHLAASLNKGAGRKATLGSVRQIGQLNRDLAEYGRSVEFVNPVMKRFSELEDLIRQLDPYYGLSPKG